MKKITFLSLLSLFTTILINAQATITVDNSQGADADYSDLQDAISNALAGDIIYVHASEINYGDILIDKELTLIGFSHSSIDKETIVGTVTLGSAASNTRISGFHITNDFFCGNTNTLTNIIIENNLFDGNFSGREIYFFDGGADDVIIRGNIITSRIGRNFSGPSLQNPVTNLIIANNIITKNIWIDFRESTTIENNIFLETPTITNRQSATGDLEVEDCIFYNASSGNSVGYNNTGVVFNNCLTFNSISGVIPLNGSNNINDTDPQFVNVTNPVFDTSFDYNLSPGSDGINNGVLGDDIGLYSTNSNFTFNNFGFTAGIPIVTITAITSQIAPGGTLDVTIESNSN